MPVKRDIQSNLGLNSKHEEQGHQKNNDARLVCTFVQSKEVGNVPSVGRKIKNETIIEVFEVKAGKLFVFHELASILYQKAHWPLGGYEYS